MAKVELGKPAAPKTNQSVEVKPIVTNADMQKPPMSKRLFHAFFMADSPKMIFDDLLFKVFVPSIKELLENMFHKGVHMMFYGDLNLPQTTSTVNPQNSFVSYGSFFSSPNQQKKTAAQVLQIRSKTDFDMPILTGDENETAREKAVKVIQQLQEIIAYRGFASVSELYQSVSRSPDFTDEYYGWKNLTGAMPVDLPDGRCLVQLPEAVLLR